MSQGTLSPDDVFAGAQRPSSLLLPGEAKTIRAIMRHVVDANAALQDCDTQEDDRGDASATAVLTSLLDSCLGEMARFGQ